jgi:hypothetical protein
MLSIRKFSVFSLGFINCSMMVSLPKLLLTERKDTKTVKERFIPGKHKDGFLAPIYLLIRHMGLFSEEGKDLKFFAELRVDK